jgi:hypothetical protein
MKKIWSLNMSKFSRQKGMFVDEEGNKVDFSFSKDATKYENAEEQYLIPHELWRNNQGGVTQTLYLTAATPGNSTIIHVSGAVAQRIKSIIEEAAKAAEITYEFL